MKHSDLQRAHDLLARRRNIQKAITRLQNPNKTQTRVGLHYDRGYAHNFYDDIDIHGKDNERLAGAMMAVLLELTVEIDEALKGYGVEA